MNDDRAPGNVGQLTAAVLIRHEEELCGETLVNLHQLADRVVVLDAVDRSNDARDCTLPSPSDTVTVLRCPWADDFATARNWFLAQLPGGWVLWLHPGERFECTQPDELRRLLSDEQNRQTVFRVLVQTPVEGSQHDVEQAEQIRLIPVHDRLRYSGRVGESLEPAIMLHRFRVATAPGTIAGTAVAQTTHFKQRRAAEVLRLVDLERSESDQLPLSALLAAGNAWCDLEQPRRARESFREVIRRAAAGTPRMLEAYYGLLATYADTADQRNEQLATCVEALRAFPFDAQLLCAMGNCLQQMDRFDLAAKSFEAAFRFGQIEPSCWHLRDIKPLAAACWSVCLQLQGHEKEARAVLEEAVVAHPRSRRLQRRLLDLYVQGRRKDDALRVVATMDLPSHEADALRWAVRGACYAAESKWAEALAWLQQAYSAQCRDPLCLRWLCVTLLSNAQVEAAKPVLRQWLEVEPQNTEARTYWNTLFGTQQPEPVEQPEKPVPVQEPGAERQYRLDPAATITQVLCPQSPVISQFSSTDVASHVGPHIPILANGPIQTGQQPANSGAP